MNIKFDATTEYLSQTEAATTRAKVKDIFYIGQRVRYLGCTTQCYAHNPNGVHTLEPEWRRRIGLLGTVRSVHSYTIVVEFDNDSSATGGFTSAHFEPFRG